jgi:hypothetical protein
MTGTLWVYLLCVCRVYAECTERVRASHQVTDACISASISAHASKGAYSNTEEWMKEARVVTGWALHTYRQA